MPPDASDLSGGTVDEVKARIKQDELAEEIERRKWKTFLLWAVFILILIFYGVFFHFIFDTLPSLLNSTKDGAAHDGVVIAAILVAIPTLMVVNLLKVVQKRNSPGSDEELEHNPWFALLKEILEALRHRS